MTLEYMQVAQKWIPCGQHSPTYLKHWSTPPPPSGDQGARYVFAVVFATLQDCIEYYNYSLAPWWAVYIQSMCRASIRGDTTTGLA